MRISKYFIVLGLLAGAVAPISFALENKANEVKADGVKDLSTIISSGNVSYSTSSIGNFSFDFALSEQIFSNTGYLNDHINEYLDENGDPIDLANGIIVNGQTFGYWINFTPENFSFPRNSGVFVSPLYHQAFNPLAIQVTQTSLAFKVNLNYFPMDSIVVTFKAGVFEGYNAGTKYTLSEDLTFYSTLNETPTSSNSGKIAFVKARNETIINAQISNISDWGESTNSQGGKYRRYVLWTNTPMDRTYVPDVYAATHWAFGYNNYELNGKSFTYYNTWARGNSKDFTDLADNSSITAEYEAAKPGGTIGVNECFALTMEHPSDQTNYVAIVYVPNAIKTDFSISSYSFSLRDGSAWFTKDENNNSIIGRINRAAFSNMVASATLDLESYVDLADYNPSQQTQISSIIADAQAQMLNAFTQIGLNSIVAAAKAEIDALPDAQDLLEQEHIDAVVALIDAIPATIVYTEECGASIKAAKEAYTSLTAAEIAKFPAAKLTALYEADAAFTALDLANYKALSKAEIRAAYNALDYRPLEQSALADILEIADAAIDAATSRAMVESAVSAFRASLALIKTDAEYITEELSTAKTNAKAELDAINLDLYRTEERAKVEEIISKGKIAIDQCKSVQEVQTLLNKIKNVIASIKTDAQLSAQSAHDAQVAKQRRNIALISVAGSLALIASVGLVVLFVRKRKTN